MKAFSKTWELHIATNDTLSLKLYSSLIKFLVMVRIFTLKILIVRQILPLLA